MPRRGYREEQQFPLRVIDLLPVNGTPMTWSEIWEKAQAQIKGISRGTLSKHLQRLVAVDLLLHEGRSYRRNPINRSMVLLSEFELHEGRAGLQKKFHEDFAARRRRLPILQAEWLRPDGSDVAVNNKTVADPEILSLFLHATIQEALAGYLAMLEAIGRAPTSSTAREIGNLIMDAEIRPILMWFARKVWEERHKVAFDSLNGDQLRFIIKRTRTSQNADQLEAEGRSFLQKLKQDNEPSW